MAASCIGGTLDIIDTWTEEDTQIDICKRRMRHSQHLLSKHIQNYDQNYPIIESKQTISPEKRKNNEQTKLNRSDQSSEIQLL